MARHSPDLLVRRLKALDFQTQRQTVAALAAAGGAAIGPVCAFLARETWDVKPLAAEVLGEIAERSKAPELRSALPLLRRELRKVSVALFFTRGEDHLDRVEQVARAYRTAIARIEAATGTVRSLPVPAHSSETSADDLPIASSAPGSAMPESGDG